MEVQRGGMVIYAPRMELGEFLVRIAEAFDTRCVGSRASAIPSQELLRENTSGARFEKYLPQRLVVITKGCESKCCI